MVVSETRWSVRRGGQCDAVVSETRWSVRLRSEVRITVNIFLFHELFVNSVVVVTYIHTMMKTVCRLFTH